MHVPLRRRLRRSLLTLGLGAALTAGALAAAAPAGAAPGHADGDGYGHGGTAPEVVGTTEGRLRGSVVDATHRTFEGVPYAAPPVGDLRFRPPAPVEPWRGVRDATAPGPQCAQLTRQANPETYGEDCLYLNVTTPAGLDAAAADLPVMVWIHGGSWVYGAGANYDASELALEGDVVVVTINYRLGPLGFLAQDDLSRDNGAVGSGSAGLLDQQAALRWVERNAAAFGGDPDRVTVFGESAGGSSVCAQLAAPGAAGLFDRAIPQSYSCAARYEDLPTAEAKGARVAELVGCTDPATRSACLRTPGEDFTRRLLTAWRDVGGGAFVVGGSALPVQPADAIASGAWNRVPVVHGNLSDENTLFTPLTPLRSTGAPPPPTLTVEQYEAEIRARYGDRAADVLARYPASAYPSPLRALAEVASDASGALSTCEHVEAYELLADRTPTFAYQFRDETASPLIDFPYPAYPEDASHAGELPFLFPGLFGEPLTAEQQDLATTMVGYWTTFAATGDPDGRDHHGRDPDGRDHHGDLPAWHRYADPGDVQGLDIASDGGVGPVDVAADAECAFWATV
ncbi:carboxylesterase/lipase family protein [Geodermatophilus maliterrae]|uniref:Carboxylic ester hydrolase n=1 Tax=Geodermatophilus maliterrae TaxID=3162531 RepID=A0ABV3XKB4_9ACTN